MNVVIVGGHSFASSGQRRRDHRARKERSRVVRQLWLAHYVGGVIEEESSLLLQTPESLRVRFQLDVRVNSEVVDLDPLARRVSVRHLAESATYELTYDVLILSPGAAPIVPSIPGIERALTLRTVEDVERMVNAVRTSPAAMTPELVR